MSPKSVPWKRTLRQIYGDLYRWFYWTAEPDPPAAAKFYLKRLKKGLRQWAPSRRSGPHDQAESERRRLLRQDAIWLFCGQAAADTDSPAGYLDPHDFVRWALPDGKVTGSRIPKTLVGRSHGDLHGRNVLVGVRRGEAEFPVVIDYGEMSDTNVLAWDFAKLEMELKTRLIPQSSKMPKPETLCWPGERINFPRKVQPSSLGWKMAGTEARKPVRAGPRSSG